MRAGKTGQSSFTLIETIIALGLMVTIILQVTSVQGHSIEFSEFERKATQAAWLGKGIMSHIEYGASKFDLKELRLGEKEVRVPEEMCPKDPSFDCDFKYTAVIDDWKLPIVDIVAKQLGDPAIAGIVQQQMKQILGDDFLKVASVSVMWGEGSRKDSVDLALLLTNMSKIDSTIQTIKPPDSTVPKDGKKAPETDKKLTPTDEKGVPPKT